MDGEYHVKTEKGLYRIESASRTKERFVSGPGFSGFRTVYFLTAGEIPRIPGGIRIAGQSPHTGPVIGDGVVGMLMVLAFPWNGCILTEDCGTVKSVFSVRERNFLA